MANSKKISTKRRRQFANSAGLAAPIPAPKSPLATTTTQIRPAKATVTPYPAPTPAVDDLRTQGEASISTERVTMSVRMRFNPLRGLTPDRLVGYLEQFDMGFFRNAALIWDRWEKRDYKLRTVIPKRKKAVARHGFEILTVDNIPDDQKGLAEKQASALTYFYNNLTATDALKPDQQGGLSLLVRQMRDADSKYFAVHEIVWQPGRGPTGTGLTAQFVFCPLWWFEGTTGKLRYMDSEFQVYGRDMLPAEWLVTCGEGLMEACSVAAMLKQLSLSDWLNFNERYGQPFLDAATSASPGSDDWDKLVGYVQNFCADGGGVRSQSAEIKMVESSLSAADTFAKMVENMDRAMTTIWRGGDLGTTSAKDQNGASLQADETDILETDDAVATEETLATGVSRFVISYLFGADAPILAYLKFKKQDQQNVTLDLQIDSFLLNAGAPLEMKNTLERYGRPMPEAGAELLRAAPVAIPGKTEPDNDDPVNADPDFANEDVIADVLHEMLLPLLKRLEAIAQVDDAGIQQHMIAKLLKDYPAIASAIQADDSLAHKLSPTLSGALIAGLRGNAELANGDVPGHEFHGNQYTEAVGQIKSVMSGKSDEAVYAKVTPAVAAQVKATGGPDVSSHSHFIDRDSLIHINRQHGVGKEDQPGHLPVTKDDIERIPAIVASPDHVEYSGKSARGLDTVKYHKRFSDGTNYYVEEHWSKGKLLAAKTMYKTKAPGNSATPKGGVSHTSKTSGA